MWRAPQKMSAERKTVSDLLVVRVLNQLLGVFQFSYEVVLRRNMKRQNFKSVVPHISTAETDTLSPFPLRFLGLWSRSGLCFYPADLVHYSQPIAAQFQMTWKCPPPETGMLPSVWNDHFNLPHFFLVPESFNPHLFLQGRHSLLEVKLQSLIRLWQEFVHSIRQALVVLLIHLLSLPCLYGERNHVTSAGKVASG